MVENKQLKDRWYVDDDFILRRINILRSFKKGNFLNFSKNTEGYIDVRGIHLNTDENSQTINSLKIRRNNLSKIDFSHSDLSNTNWINCTFRDCKFENTLFSDVIFVNCNFSNTVFVNSIFQHCNLAKNFYKGSGTFSNVSFYQCLFNYVDFCFPIIDTCRFHSCKMNEVDFDGSRFKNSEFVGKMEAADFRGFSRKADNMFLGLFKVFDPKDFKNTMANIDFSQADMDYVGFSYEIDLTTCRFPVGEKYVLVKNPELCYQKVKESIQKNWNETEKKIALDYMELIDFRDSKKGMKLDFLTIIYQDDEAMIVKKKLFELIRSLCNTST